MTNIYKQDSLLKLRWTCHNLCHKFLLMQESDTVEICDLETIAAKAMTDIDMYDAVLIQCHT